MQAALPAPLYYRNLQKIKNKALRQFQEFNTVVILDRNAIEELTWWQESLQSWNGKAVLELRPDIVVETVAWMGCSLARNTNGRPVVRRQTITSYQPAGVDSRRVRSQDLCSPQEKHAPQNGQEDSYILYPR